MHKPSRGYHQSAFFKCGPLKILRIWLREDLDGLHCWQASCPIELATNQSERVARSNLNRSWFSLDFFMFYVLFQLFGWSFPAVSELKYSKSRTWNPVPTHTFQRTSGHLFNGEAATRGRGVGARKAKQDGHCCYRSSFQSPRARSKLTLLCLCPHRVCRWLIIFTGTSSHFRLTRSCYALDRTRGIPFSKKNFA